MREFAKSFEHLETAFIGEFGANSFQVTVIFNRIGPYREHFEVDAKLCRNRAGRKNVLVVIRSSFQPPVRDKPRSIISLTMRSKVLCPLQVFLTQKPNR